MWVDYLINGIFHFSHHILIEALLSAETELLQLPLEGELVWGLPRKLLGAEQLWALTED